MENAIVWSLKVLGQVLVIVMLAPFLIPAYAIARLMGTDPFDMDGMGMGFLVMVLAAGAMLIALVSFGLGRVL